jgi:hypothetical protein
MAETLLSFAAPSLSATQTELTGKAALEIARVDVIELMRNPELARAAQTLALGMSTATREARNASYQTDIIDAEIEEPLRIEAPAVPKP